MKITSMLRHFAVSVALASAAAGVACTPATTEAAAPAPEQSAAAPSDEQHAAALNTMVADFTAAWQAADYAKMVELSIPQTLLDQIMKQSGIDPASGAEPLRKEILALMEQTLAQATIIETSIDATGAKIETAASGRKWAYVPATVVMEVQGTRLRSVSNYLALTEGERWYLVNPSTAAAIAAIRAAFPDLADVALTEPKIEVLSQ
jgi:hypothetical protein